MANDKRIKSIKVLTEAKSITSFEEIFDYIPKTVVAADLKIHFNRMVKMIADVKTIKLNDIFLFSSYFNLDPKLLFELINNQYNNRRVPPKAKK